MGWTLLAVAVWFCAAGNEENLLANPGFEDIIVDRPARWDLFLLPQEGAAGRLDDGAHGGKYAVMLHIPMPYDRDPINNWSQNLFGDFAGKTVCAAGYIKVAEATEAALWVQCWRKRPWTLLLAASTSTESPLYGSRDWERVEMSLDVPKDTDFLTFRCVLKGTGTAWFDDLELTVAEIKPEAKPAAATEQNIGDTSSPKAETKAPEASAASPAEPPPGAVAAETGASAAALTAIETEMTRLRQANLELAGALQEIQAANTRLMDELMLLRDQLRDMARQTSESGRAEEPAPVLERAPPLVPHGVDWRIYR